jgi:hypothetical protein
MTPLETKLLITGSVGALSGKTMINPTGLRQITIKTSLAAPLRYLNQQTLVVSQMVTKGLGLEFTSEYKS